MTEKEQLRNDEYSTNKEISFLLKTIPENKSILNRFRLFALILINILIIPFSMFTSSFNPLLFFLNIFKIISIYTTVFSFIYLAFGDANSIDKWHKKSLRKKEIKGRLLHVLKEACILLMVSSSIFGLIHLSGLPRYIEVNFLEENPGLEFPLNYQPTISELLLIISIITLLLLTQVTLIYWIYSRCAQYKGYNTEKKLRRIDTKRFFICLSIVFIIFGIILTIILDDLFVSTKFPDIMTSWDKYDTVFASNPEIILIIELVIIILLNIFYITDGLLANKFRTNFVEMDYH